MPTKKIILDNSHKEIMNRSLVTMRLLAVCLALIVVASAFDRTTLFYNANAASLNTAIPTLAQMSEFQKGIVYASWWHDEYSSPASDAVLSHSILPLGANWVSIVVTCYQQKINSTRIHCKPESSTPTDDNLTHVIQYAHSLGLRVMLKPHLDLADDPGHWRGQICFDRDEAAWNTWFASYTQFISHYAKLAQDTNTDYLVIGTELVKTTHRADDWRSLIEAVRKTYSGRLTYAAHHFDEEFTINWWDAVDAIGIDAYYPLAQSYSPTLAQLKTAWRPIVAQLEKLSDRWNRPVILTEIGYESLAGTSMSP